MFDVTIIGCGVIGALLARKLSQYDLRILILERENDVAMGTTKANSAIVHAGYDPEPGTLMSKLNVQGSEQMEKLCRELDVDCLLYISPSPRDPKTSRMPSSA